MSSTSVSGVSGENEPSKDGKAGQPVEPQPIEPEQGSDLATRLKEVDGVSDDAAVFLAENWFKFVGAVVLMVLALLGFNQFKASSELKVAHASDGFVRIQQTLKEVENAGDDEQKKRSLTSFQDSVDILESKYGDTVYAHFAPLYRAKLLINEGNVSGARDILRQVSGGRFDSANLASFSASNLTPEVIAKEFAAFLEAKSWLLTPDQDKAKARSKLKQVAYGTSMFAGEALISLLQSSGSAEEKAEIAALASEVLDAKPYLREQVESVFTLEGVKLE